MKDELLAAVEGSDNKKALECFAEMRGKGQKAWDIHLSLFPAAQRVLNPPYINPHWPKMYGVCRDLAPYLEEEQIEPLVRLEVNEYAKRAKLEKPAAVKAITQPVSFVDVENAIGADDREKTTALLAAYAKREGRRELARRLLLLGSGYLDKSLGHSISCTAFILLETLERPDEDLLPMLWALAHYFCKGRFQATPRLRTPEVPSSEYVLTLAALKATSGRGFINLHHTITLYAVERVRHLFTPEEHHHLLAALGAFMGTKEIKKVALPYQEAALSADYHEFYQLFSRQEAVPVAALLNRSIDSAAGVKQVGQFLVRGVCDMYNGDYDPH